MMVDCSDGQELTRVMCLYKTFRFSCVGSRVVVSGLVAHFCSFGPIDFHCEYRTCALVRVSAIAVQKEPEQLRQTSLQHSFRGFELGG